jgi:tryptophanyl-tRNA synthetase
VTLTGVQPTGDLHLGNYIGAVRPLSDLAADPARDVYDIDGGQQLVH